MIDKPIRKSGEGEGRRERGEGTGEEGREKDKGRRESWRGCLWESMKHRLNDSCP